MTDNRPIHIAVLAPLSVDKLDAAAEKEHRRERPFGDQHHPWELRAGTGTYSALLTREPGTEASEWPIAEILSRTAADAVYSLWLDPDYPQMIYEFRRGKKVGERQGDPFAHARSLGVELAAHDMSAPSNAPAIVTVAVVDGLGGGEVRAMLGSIADEGWLNITEAGGSAILSAADGDLRSAPWDLTDALPDRDIYFIHGDRERRELNIQVLRGGETTGTFYAPAAGDPGALTTIKGATTVSAILDALGVAPALFPRDLVDVT
jgi:hypothetical protein